MTCAGGVRELSWNLGDTRLVSGGFDAKAILTDTHTGAPLVVRYLHNNNNNNNTLKVPLFTRLLCVADLRAW